MRQKILLLTGSMNQTTQMLCIADELREYDCWFSQMFTDSPLLNYLLDHTRLLNKTILAKPFRNQAEQYLRSQGAQIDYRAEQHTYDLVICCSDLIVPHRLRRTKTVWIQEGMIDRMTILSSIVKALKLPATLCFNTSLNGSSDICDLYCTASEGYKQHLVAMGTDPGKIFVTGMPNYDHASQYRHNDFPHHNYVMVATTDMRETTRWENRPRFIRSCVTMAGGRQLLFKLHPNEHKERAIREIRTYAPPGTLIYTEGNTHEMIANCSELITQYSTVVYTGIALGKKVHSWFDVTRLQQLAPLQNQGRSAENIAGICSAYLSFDGSAAAFIRSFSYKTNITEPISQHEPYAG